MKKNGFTLIELLAVIIILGILMIIAIPSVTRYISDSRKSSYISTAKENIIGARNKVNDGKLGMFDTDATYYIPANYIKTENANKSPYGEFTEAYVVITYNGKGYNYYWTSVDDAGEGIKNIVAYDKLETDDVESDLTNDMIDPNITKRGVGDRSKILILDPETEAWKEVVGGATTKVPEEGEKSNGSNESSNIVCKKVTYESKLHKTTCVNNSTFAGGCVSTIGNGNEIIYGTLPSGNPKAGDAYDCKVTKNGNYTERFYYLTNEGENAILIYYKNLNNDAIVAYDSTNQNNNGPRTAYQFLPSTEEWNNPRLIAPGIRDITTEKGKRIIESYSGNKDIDRFDYNDKAARFATYQEINAACGVNPSNGSSLSNCNYLMENVPSYEKNTGFSGYWLETPYSTDIYDIWVVYGISQYLSGKDASTSYSSGYGVRPVITIRTTDLEQ